VPLRQPANFVPDSCNFEFTNSEVFAGTLRFDVLPILLEKDIAKDIAMRDLANLIVITLFAMFVFAVTASAFAAGTGYGQ
jgi:hypothetical protein